MKAKSIFQCAALLTGLLFLNVPLFAAVESDIVGYTTISMEAGKWYQVGCPFFSLDNTVTKAKLNDVFNTGFADGDMMYIYYEPRQRYLPLSWNSEQGGWCSGSNLSTFEMEAAQAVFIKKAVTADVVVRGRVETPTSAEFGSDAGNHWNQIAIASPTKKSLNGDLVWEGMADGDMLHVYYIPRQRYLPLTWNTELGGWCSGSTLSTFTMDECQGLFLNKKSTGKGYVSLRQ